MYIILFFSFFIFYLTCFTAFNLMETNETNIQMQRTMSTYTVSVFTNRKIWKSNLYFFSLYMHHNNKCSMHQVLVRTYVDMTYLIYSKLCMSSYMFLLTKLMGRKLASSRIFNLSVLFSHWQIFQMKYLLININLDISN